MGSMKLMLKLDRKGEADGDLFACGECGKEFGSRKALAGHTRVHNEVKGNDGAVYPAKPTCKICFKSFPSEKSLFGHMRCHPERGYRGMNPPALVKKSGDFDLGRLPPECRKRRTCGGREEEYLMIGAVYGLMLLATGDEAYRVVPPRAYCYDDETLTRVFDSDSDSDSDSDGGGRKRRRVEEPKTYTCIVCKRSFATPQALGGHTSSAHNKRVVLEDGVVVEEECGGVHVCKVCQKEFPSGRALGGHMRLHFQAAPAQAEAQQAEKKKVLMCLDLNEMPVDDEDELN